MKKLLFALAFALPFLFVKNESFALPPVPSGYEYSILNVHDDGSAVFLGFSSRDTDSIPYNIYLYKHHMELADSDEDRLFIVSDSSLPTFAILFNAYYYFPGDSDWGNPRRGLLPYLKYPFSFEGNQFYSGYEYIQSSTSLGLREFVTPLDFLEGRATWNGEFLNFDEVHFDPDIPTLKLYRTNLYSYDAHLDIRDSKCYIWCNTLQDLFMVKFNKVEYKLYVNNVYMDTFVKDVPLSGNELSTLITFDYSQYGISDGDLCSIQAKAFKDKSYGLTSSLVWTATGKAKPPVSSTPNVNTEVPIGNGGGGIVGVIVKTITENNTYNTYNYDNSVNETYYDYSQSYITNEYVTNETVNNYITNNIQNITNNYYYNTNISVNYGESDGETFKGVRTQFQGWVEDLIGRVQVLSGTPFAPILFTFVAVIGALVAAALIFVLIKIVGLIL